MWKTFSLKQKGLSHEQSNTCCQDNVLISQDDRWIVAALADGLGSLRYSEVAAEVATTTVCNFSAELLESIIKQESSIEETVIEIIANAIRDKVTELSFTCSDLDCTLVFAIIDKQTNHAAIGRLGDSAAILLSESNSIVISDSDHSANGTNAVLDSEAAQHLFLRSFNLEEEKIVGIMLTSDGLDNELYLKGSKHVQKITGLYFNAVSASKQEEDAKRVIGDRIAKLTGVKDSSFDDDISLAILSRIDYPIDLPEDPTWLCSCGTRNYLQQTYCRKCNKDFSILYQNIRFRDYGGKDAFFTAINKDPNEERRLVGLPIIRDEQIKPRSVTPRKPISENPNATSENVNITKNGTMSRDVDDGELRFSGQSNRSKRTNPVATPNNNGVRRTSGNASLGKKIRTSGVRTNKRFRLPKPIARLLPLIICLIVGLVLGLIINGASSSKKIKSLNAEVDSLREQVDTLTSETPTPSGDVKETVEPQITPSPIPTENPTDFPSETPNSTPESFVVLQDGSYYWGPVTAGIPNGYGILLQEGRYYIGRFEGGLKNGKFIIINSTNMNETETVEYENDALVIPVSPTPQTSNIPSEPPEQNTPNPSQTPEPHSPNHYRLNSNARLRKEPGIHTEVICELESGTEVELLVDENVSADNYYWVKVKTDDNQIGWIAKHFLSPIE